ncbi:Murein DD-endopeptidase MepM and murein hydrolase activator NlpD, contain LysM domain [Geodermatophilus africanus]|uniref:Murein DD-endopeptidase MepM and murein hydrolase activator NlpD, contain LysM domain n=1 Tax=Geodermatophilus africanus TaxID=1137993 RepID=A0A1H3NGL0_9ACTN|nr:M23 family metallopeptidase [Geodermatophilus africanus]SDY88051.1 Murein DD-endopeptidase MepM and murein hydrolase activator NlpD, contain LysM domain [Geodermatophilus africanus]
MSQLHHDRPVDDNETAPHTVRTQRTGDALTPDTATEEQRLTAVTDLADLTGQAEAAARAGLEEVHPVPVTTGGRRRRFRTRGIPAPARRPAVYLAAALVGAGGLGLFAVGDRALAQQTDVVESSTVSIATELGLDGRAQAAPPEDDAAARLGELTASRAAREAEQAAAAQVQADADRLAAEAIAEAARPDAVLPVDGARLTSGFGSRWGTVHAGIDLAAPMRTPEKAAMDGVVLEAGPASGYGLVVYVQHENGDVTVYGHMDEVLVSAGQVVRAGDTIALLGNRGQSTGPHLHFEVRLGGLGGQKVDPVPYLRERGVQL